MSFKFFEGYNSIHFEVDIEHLRWVQWGIYSCRGCDSNEHLVIYCSSLLSLVVYIYIYIYMSFFFENYTLKVKEIT
jgi:hypothetical protein